MCNRAQAIAIELYGIKMRAITRKLTRGYVTKYRFKNKADTRKIKGEHRREGSLTS